MQDIFNKMNNQINYSYAKKGSYPKYLHMTKDLNSHHQPSIRHYIPKIRQFIKRKRTKV